MNNLDLYYKLVISNITSYYINQHKTQLQQDLYAKASDPVIFKRRFRMLSQLAEYESQIYKKIHNFKTNDIDDYVSTMQQILIELYNVTDRSG